VEAETDVAAIASERSAASDFISLGIKAFAL
jgi:hypothetical protein